MIVIAGTLNFLDPDERDACVAASVPMVLATRQDEPGCLGYSFTADPAEPTQIAVFELWEDEDSLAKHFAHPNFSAMREILRGYRRAPSAVQKHRIVLSEPVYDQTGTPRADFVTEAS